MSAPLASVLVLSEDSASDSADTLAALFRRMLGVIDPDCQAHLIEFEPLQSTEARRAMRANFWRSTNPRDQRDIESLRRAIATKLLEDPPGFVVFHSDGDTAWSRRANSTIAPLFEARIRTQVRLLIEKRGLPGETQEEIMSRLFLFVPHYSIESWLYQNTTCALRLCDRHHQGRDKSLFLSWSANRMLLDEVDKPKETTCLRADHNLELAREQYPADAVYGESPSFTAAVDLVLACRELIARLAPPWKQVT